MLDAVGKMKRTTWAFVSQNAQVQGVDQGRLTLGFSTAGLRDVFLSRSDHQDFVREALIQVLGVDWKIDAIVVPGTADVAPSAAQAPSTPAAPVSSGRAAAEAAVAAEAVEASGRPQVEDTPSADDPDADDGDLSHHDLLARELGAKVIGEYDAS